MLWALWLLMLCLMLPVKSLATPASEVWVNGVEVSAGGTVPGVQYDAANGILTLTDATLTQTHEYAFHDAVIHANGDLTIVLVGDNTIRASGTAVAFLDGIYCEGSVTFEGSGSLSVEADGSASEQYGLSLGYPGSDRDTAVKVRGGSITLVGKTAGLYADTSYSSSPLEKRLSIEGGSMTLVGQRYASSISPQFDGGSFTVTASYDGSGSPVAEYSPFNPGNCYYKYLKVEKIVYDEYGFGPGLNYQPAVKAGDGAYEIGNAGQLFWFAQKTAETGGASLDARLTKDIVIPDGKVFSPIGGSQGGSSYSGTFDGQGHSVTGVTISSDYPLSCTGFVGKLHQGGVIRNVRLKDVSIEGDSASNAFFVGAICSINNGTIENCSIESGNVVARSYVGGICGENNGTIRLCVNAATVSATSNAAGGICGENNGTMENCLNTGRISAQWCIGGICGLNGPGAMVNSCLNIGNVTATLPEYERTAGGIAGDKYTMPVNSYYLAAAEGSDGARTEGQLLGGEVTWLLNGSQPTGAWGQTLDGGSMPGLGGKAVYYGYTSCDGSTGYANDALPGEVPAHRYDYQHDADKHWQACSVCGATGESAKHALKWTGDEKGHSATCEVCGYATEQEGHRLKWTGDEKGHSATCKVCGYVTAQEGHRLEWTSDEKSHSATCEVCGYATAQEGHRLKWTGDEKGHSATCEVCGYGTAQEAHTLKWTGDEKGHSATCEVCGYGTAQEAHTLKWTSDKKGHSASCEVCGYATAQEAHAYGSDRICEICGYEQRTLLPLTGDGAWPGVWIALMLSGGLGAVVAFKRKRTA